MSEIDKGIGVNVLVLFEPAAVYVWIHVGTWNQNSLV